MGYQNPPVPWSEFERRLSDRGADGRRHLAVSGADGGVSPAWTNHRTPYEPIAEPSPLHDSGFAELHAHSSFSFGYGAAHPEQLVEEAVRLGLSALALTDHDGFYGVVRFAEAARPYGLRTVFGADIGVGNVEPHRPGRLLRVGDQLVVLARSAEGYRRLALALTEAQLAGEKGAPRASLEQLASHAQGHWIVLTGTRSGAVAKALQAHGPAAAEEEMRRIVQHFGREHVFCELWDHGHPVDSVRNDTLVRLATRHGIECVATTDAHHAAPKGRHLADVVTAIRARRSLDDIVGWLPAGTGAHLRSGAEMLQRFARYPGVVERAGELGIASAFDLSLVAPKLPAFPVPPGHTESTWLRVLVEHGAKRRYGARNAERVAGAWEQIDHELRVIEALGFPGYFLVVWDLVEFCRREDIYCQGRGSAANSAVCYTLGVTKADAVSLGLLFERFLSPERDGPPDIDLDIESGRREEVIQYVYERYGRQNAAQVANVITYRARSSVRDVGRALGHPTGVLDAWARHIDAWGPVAATAEQSDNAIPPDVMQLAFELEHHPRHLGIHSGGMVICDRPVSEVVPVEWARMANRSVLQWDKDDSAAVGLVKFDLLGLGMLTMLHIAHDMVRDTAGVDVDLAGLPQEQAVYDMLCVADTVGVFQVESRAQMATLPRLKPRTFYDIVVEVALIRPGPIQGGSVHPYLRRRDGLEPVTYLHPLLEGALAKTLGVPLFQEQLMQMAVDVAGFSPAEADRLRQAMGAKRSHERMDALRQRFFDGARERGVPSDDVIDQIWQKLQAFANFGFPESHSVSFAYLVYASAWYKLYWPAAFSASLLNAQPMGFWSPATICADARRHGVEIRRPDVNASLASSSLVPCAQKLPLRSETPAIREKLSASFPHRRDQQFAVQLGLHQVRDLGDELAARIELERIEHGPFEGPDDLARRCGVGSRPLEALATAGAFASCGLDRRAALWAAGPAAEAARGDTLAGTSLGVVAPQLPGLSDVEVMASDIWATGISTDSHPMAHVRPFLAGKHVVLAEQLTKMADQSRVVVAGIVTHRQRPATAQGTTFMNLEDETGLVNVICSKGCWARYRRVTTDAPALMIRGRLERSGLVVNIVADKIESLDLALSVPRSRDFR